MNHIVSRGWVIAIASAGLTLGLIDTSEAGGLFRRPRRPPATAVSAPVAYPTAATRTVAPPNPPGGTLGTFYRTPYIMVRGNGTAGGGYSPLGEFGNSTMALYGPLSSLRSTAAPVLTYSRGYDGRTVVTPGTAFSTPNLPAISSVVYPTSATVTPGFRRSPTPPQWASGIDWVDQN